MAFAMRGSEKGGVVSEVQDDDARKDMDVRVSALYQDLVANIKVTDDISFKLLGTVPLLSGIGSGALSLLLRSGYRLNDYAVLGLSIVGCAITFGLYKWELRNIQRCAWFISRAANIEKRLFPNGEACQFNGFDRKEYLEAENLASVEIPSFWERPWGKTRAEKLIYSAAIVAWLIPAVISVTSLVHR